MIQNIVSLLYKRADELGSHAAFQYKIKRGSYQSMSWSEAAEYVMKIAYGLAALGIVPKDMVAIFSHTSHYWVASDLAILSNAAASVPIYPTSSADDCLHILDNSQAKYLFVENERLLAKIATIEDQLPLLQAVIILSPIGDNSATMKKVKVLTLDDLIAGGTNLQKTDPSLIKARINQVNREDICTIIYTSGTTGTPKGVALTHGNILTVLDDIKKVFPLSEKDVYLSYLPLSHVFERVCGEYYWLHSGGINAFAEGMETMAKNMQEVHPSMLIVVPRVLDRIYAKVMSGINGATGRSKELIEWSLEVGKDLLEHRANNNRPRPGLMLKYWLAEKLVLQKLREKIGPRLRVVVSGGAPGDPKVLEFFNSIGIATLEGYGLSETSAPATVNIPNKVKVGTVGPKLESVQIKFGEENEILLAGPSIFKGYYRNEEATKEAFEDGWFKTGDIGELDSDGYLKITDRKKDLIVNSAGKNIAPQRIEAVIRGIPGVSQAVVFGDKQKHLVALLTLDEHAVIDLARDQHWEHEGFEDLMHNAKLLTYIRKEIKARSKSLADHEQVKDFSILEKDLSVDAGEMTATLKIKRNIVAKKYQELIASLYDEKVGGKR
ncbi:long-chain fatty acid--CoA ligase [bacterium]|nr:long-chain fatty acid--CoA ligase [bacterium]QQR59090.1 MAG: long-chain fatty acid--CoA ligase [Candidatus Melainabacteria bacterium]